MSPEETAGGKIRAAFGLTEPDWKAVEDRGKEIREQAPRDWRAKWGTSCREISEEESEAIAARELAGVPLIVTTADEYRQRLRNTDPFWVQDGVMSMNDGVVVVGVTPDGETVFRGGSPEVRARAAESARERRRRELGMQAGPFGAQIR